MAEIPLGTRHEERREVTSDVAISFLGVDEARVLSTPSLIGFLEMTARNLIKAHQPEGWDSVGTRVEVRHLAATPLGMTVRLEAEVVEVAEGRVTCRVEAWDDREKIAEGVHERFLIEVARFVKRVQGKKAQGAGRG